MEERKEMRFASDHFRTEEEDVPNLKVEGLEFGEGRAGYQVGILRENSR